MSRRFGIAGWFFAAAILGGTTMPSAVSAADATGAVTGTVRLAGTPPARPGLQVFKNHEICGDSVPDDRLVIGPGGGVRYAVVTVEGVKGGKKPERDATVVLDNRSCRFEPHVLTAEVGQWLELKNSDPVLHNADARLGQETLFNVALTPGRELRKPLARTGLVAIVCDVRHTWMSAFVDVTDHPYHTVTDAYGAYDIRDLPPGTYRLRVWHEGLGTQEQPLTITGGQSATVDVTFSNTPEASR
jgi:plastocyanin